MSRQMPRQKPNRSRQDYGSPPELLAALKHKLGIGQFDIDLAASAENAICTNYYDEEMNALADHNSWKVTTGGWAYCNPPFGQMKLWTEKAAVEARKGAQIAMLAPASVGSNWWALHVDMVAYVMFLSGRLTFVGESTPYPKDCAVLLYTPYFELGGGYTCWNWRHE